MDVEHRRVARSFKPPRSTLPRLWKARHATARALRIFAAQTLSAVRLLSLGMPNLPKDQTHSPARQANKTQQLGKIPFNGVRARQIVPRGTILKMFHVEHRRLGITLDGFGPRSLQKIRTYYACAVARRLMVTTVMSSDWPKRTACSTIAAAVSVEIALARFVAI